MGRQNAEIADRGGRGLHDCEPKTLGRQADGKRAMRSRSSFSITAVHSLRVTLLAILLFLCARNASALDPSLDISQYAHTAWKVRDGFVKGIIFSIAQTADGYLWLGTEFGLLRFDGVRAVPWQPPGNEQLPSTYVSRLMVSRDGTLWIGTKRGLASFSK